MYFNVCLSIKLNSLSCSFTSISFLTNLYFCDIFVILQMGYGSRALDLLQQYYEGKMISLSETKDIEDNITPVEEQVI